MAAVTSSRMLFEITRSTCFCTRLLSTSQGGLPAGQKWRISQGQAPDGLRYGPLTDLPDWSYSDGRPAPETVRRRKRMRNRLDVAQRVAQLLSEVDKAKSASSDVDKGQKTDDENKNTKEK